ncbi:hypothetical protein PanWU01x14_315240 [Parasponia andersonii]|uniref:DUF868 family protein n=1 Tax=Parasponia andersonii TaxID=3476 RepID=A0A2P5ANF6_PARAD|nr:hypothetical protein PanWU01x14_315240 [Parasponia andersonii]
MSRPSSPFPSCFRPSTTSDDPQAPPPPPPPPPPPTPPPHSGNPNLTTCLFHTDVALFSLTWSRSFIGRSLHLHLVPHAFHSPPPPLSSSSCASPSFHLHIKPFLFWKKQGSKALAPNTRIFWDLSRARFGSGPEPQSGFFVAVVVDGEMTLLVGDLGKECYAKTRAQSPATPQALVLKREHVVAKKVYSTRARFGGKLREIQIDCGNDDLSRLNFSVDDKRVLQIKRLKWKFRGNERVEVDGVGVQISWDVYNWLFEGPHGSAAGDDGRHAVFMFRFEDDDDNWQQSQGQGQQSQSCAAEKNGMALWAAQNQLWNLGMSEIEWRKMGKSLSSSSVSMSSAGSSGGSSSVMEWASMEESELCAGPPGFSLMVYAWRR